MRLPLPLLIAAALLPACAAWLYFVALDGSPYAAPVYAATKLAMVALLILAWRRADPPPALVSRRRGVLEGLLCGAATAALIALAARGPLAALLAAARPAITAKIAAFGLADHRLAAALALSFVHSALEECYWRRLIFTALLAHVRAPAAHALAAIAFAAHHCVIAAVFAGPALGLALGAAVAAAGAAWSILYRRNGTLLSPWLAHICADLAIMAVAWP